MQIRVHPAAQQELNRAIDWCLKHYGRRLAVRLYRRFELAGELLLRQPEIGTQAVAGTRTLPLGAFPYTVVYRADESCIHILALSHQSRRPHYWVRRH